MMTLVDEYLSEMLRDVGRLFGSICSVVEFALGLSYFCGATLVGWIFVAWTATLEFFRSVGDIGLILGNEFYDFGGSILRGVLLFWHGLEVIVDSFVHIAFDIKWSVSHVAKTTSEFLTLVISESWNFIDEKMTFIPTRIFESLGYVGNTSVLIIQVMWNVFLDFLYHLVFTPLLFLHFAGNLVFSILWFPVSFFGSLTSEVFLGFCILSFSLYMTCKMRLGIPYKVIQFIVFLLKGTVRSIYSFILSSVQICGKMVYLLSPSKSSSPTAEYNNALCVVCREVVVSFIAKPCKHVCLCKTCVYRLRDFGDSRCPMCRTQVTQFEQVFIPS